MWRAVAEKLHRQSVAGKDSFHNALQELPGGELSSGQEKLVIYIPCTLQVPGSILRLPLLQRQECPTMMGLKGDIHSSKHFMQGIQNIRRSAIMARWEDTVDQLVMDTIQQDVKALSHVTSVMA
jgi:hypothetical protein